MIVSFITADSGHPFTSLHVDTSSCESSDIVTKITTHLDKFLNGRDCWVVSAEGFQVDEIENWKVNELMLFAFWEKREDEALSADTSIDPSVPIPKRISPDYRVYFGSD